MLTCLASESTSPTFVTFPPQVLSTGEREARLWFPCARPEGCYCCSLSCHPCSSPTGFPVALARLKNTYTPLVWLANTHMPLVQLCHQPGRNDSMWEQGQGVTHINAAFLPHIPARVSQELWRNIKQHKTGGKISTLGRSVSAELL